MLVCAAMLLAPLLALVPLAASDPVDVDNPGYTRTVTWDFDDAGDYGGSDVTVSGGTARLALLNESVTEDSQAAYAEGAVVSNIDTASLPGSMILDETQTYTNSVMIQHNPVDGWDSHISQDRDNDNYGLQDELRIDSEIGDVYRILMRFDVGTVPTGSYIDEANLWMYQNPGGKGNDVSLNIHSLSMPFAEEEVNWNRASVADFWTAPGGDFSAGSFCYKVLDNVAGWKSFDITGLVECWVRGTITNNGMIFVPDESGADSAKDFISSDELSWPSYRPYLLVNYTLQGNEGAYESKALGSPEETNALFTLLDWSNDTFSLLTDEFSTSPLSSKWAWDNNPFEDLGSYNVGVTLPGWLHVVGSPNTKNIDENIGSNYLHQNVTGHFTATTSLQELFTVDHMSTGMLIVENGASWISISKSSVGATGEIEVVLCQEGSSSVVDTLPWPGLTAAHFKVTRDAAGFWLYASEDGISWAEVYHHAPDAPMAQKLKIGLFLASDSGAQPVAEFDFFRVDPPAGGSFEIWAMTGNSTELSDLSWTDWSGPFAGGEICLGVTSKYIRYRLHMSTNIEWVTPVFSGFTAYWERYPTTGIVETEDYTPDDFSSWLSFDAVHDDTFGAIEYYFSTDSGESWDMLGSETFITFYSQDPTIRLRATMTPYDTLLSPSIESLSLTYATELMSFYVTVPAEFTAGDSFALDIYAKNADNDTMTSWLGEVTMTAMDATGTVEASSALYLTSADITSAGHVMVTGQRYFTAETITIMVTAAGAAGVSAPITVAPGPAEDLLILPQDLNTIIEGTTEELQAQAVDHYGNAVPGMEYSWAITESLGQLSSTTGSTVIFIAGDAHAIGYVTVTCDGLSASRFITVECLGHPPEFSSPVPDQYAVEDDPTWTYDLSPIVDDPTESDDMLRWYVTGEDLVTASNENKTGSLMLTLTPKPDMYGDDRLDLFVVDQEGEIAQTNFTVHIEAVNDAPVLSSIPPLVVKHDSSYVFNMRYYIEDVDNDYEDLSLSVDVASLPYVDVDSSKLSLVFTYPEDLLGTTQIVGVTVSDGLLESSSAIAVSVSDDNVPVQILSLPSIVLYQGEALLRVLDLDDHFIDPDGDDLHYTVGESNVFINITSTNEVNVYALTDWSGEEYVVFSAIDPEGARVEAAALVTVLPVNQAPWIADVPDLKVRFDVRYDFDVARYMGDDDDPLDALMVSTDDPYIAVIGTVLSMMYPALMDSMTIGVTITVSDGDLEDSWTINITISDNTPPESLGLKDHAFTEDWPIPYPSSGSLEDLFEDAEDGDDLTFEAFPWGAEMNVTIVKDPVEGTAIEFSPMLNYYGEMKVSVRATDTEGAFVEDTMTLTVSSSPDAPHFDINRTFTVTVDVEVSYDLSSYVTDPDSEPSQLTLEVETEYAEYISATSTLVRMHFPASFLKSGETSRTIEVVVRVVDQDGLCDSSTLHITVMRAAIAQNVSPWEIGLFLIIAGISVALFAMVLMMRKKPFVVRDMMLVHEDGFLISRHETVEHDDSMDEDIFTGMLTAVLNFVEDSMSTSQDQLKFFGFEDYRVMIQRGSKIYAAIVFEGDRPKDIETKLAEFLARVEKVYRKSLEHWTGDMEIDFAGAHLLIEAFVKENGKKGKGKNGNGKMTKRDGPVASEDETHETPAPLSDLPDAVDEPAAAEVGPRKRKLKRREADGAEDT